MQKNEGDEGDHGQERSQEAEEEDYLGMPLRVSPRLKSTWKPVINKFLHLGAACNLAILAHCGCDLGYTEYYAALINS
ncbi:hypothetical protein Acr_09g0007060 [Actinidia rufa]|uniref:Uncharacterized protein n=1 Tax=Actinidia rufa TaxID=165716 RepID=A0A7J0F6F8_9ERIC|nr:hypothetical protein Acr_09g0007060 [Actinidia rufa]